MAQFHVLRCSVADMRGVHAHQLNDDRVLVVEYKGEHVFAEAEEKRTVGAVWESPSKGKCLFLMPEGKDLEKIRQAIA